jgi:DnaJ-class molecular chaperone
MANTKDIGKITDCNWCEGTGYYWGKECMCCDGTGLDKVRKQKQKLYNAKNNLPINYNVNQNENKNYKKDHSNKA